MTPRILKDMNLFVDGRGYAGQATELTLPKLTRKTEEHLAGGMAAPMNIDMGLEKLEASFTLTGFNEAILRQWGFTGSEGISVRFKGSISPNDGGSNELPVSVAMRGSFTELDWGSWKPAEVATLKVTMSVTYYQYTQNGQALFEIDGPNGIEIVDGVDRLAQRRVNLGTGG